ncbi:MAG: fumarylacetoacetate hydrolase family protein [Bacteroidota bacterium]
MKIFAIGRNYAAHAAELKNDLPTEPVVFMKPDTALVKNNADFYLPDFSTDIHHEIEIVLKVCKEGKNIAPEFAHRYWDELAIGIDFTARDLQQKLKSQGLPWELSKSFDNSAPISEFVPKTDFPNPDLQHFHLDVNGERRQTGDTSTLIFNYSTIITFLSRYFTLKKGDLIYTGTPAGVAAVKAGDRLQGYLEGKEMINFLVK